MKKIFVCLLLALLFSGCEKEAGTPSEFDMSVTLTADGTEYFCTYEKREEYDRLTVNEPKRFCNAEFLLRDGVCTVTVGEVSFVSDGLSRVFDFLPVTAEGEKTVGDRVYRFFDLRGVE